MRKKKKPAVLPVVLLFTLILAGFVRADDDVSFKSKPEGDIRTHGNSIVWMSYSSGNWDIYHLDKSTGVETQITHDKNTQGYPDVWQNYIVWQDNREHTKSGLGSFDIYLYDITSGQEKKISNIEGDHQDPIISDNKVVWVDNKDGDKNIMLYDIQNQTIEKVSSNEAEAFGVAFDGRVIAWVDARGGDFDIYMYDISQKVEKQLTHGLGDELDPLVSGGKVVWMVEHNKVSQVYMYDTQNGYTTKLTVGDENHRPIAFSEDSLLIIQGNKLALNNVNSITEQPIKSTTGTIPKQAFLSGDKVIWYDGRSLTTEKITDAVNRGLLAENNPEEPSNPDPKPTPTPTPSSPSPSSSASSKEDKNGEKEEVNGRKLVKADEDKVITSQDGRMTIKITKGSFDKDVHITIYQDMQYKADGYLSLTPVYRWNIEEDAKLLKPMEISISYRDIAINDNTKKICLYEIQQNKAPKPITLKVDHKTNTLAARVKGSGRAALMIYNKDFNDIEKHWAYDVVKTIAAHHIINGYEDGSFKPDKEMSRAEFVKILISSLNIDEEEVQPDNKSTFQDVPDNCWASEYIYIAYKKGWISGFNGSFNPNSPVTREQMVSILMRAYEDISTDKGYEESDLSGYKDKGEISSWALDSMKRAAGLDIIKGYNNEINPQKNAARAEAAAMIYRYLEKLGRM